MSDRDMLFGDDEPFGDGDPFGSDNDDLFGDSGIDWGEGEELQDELGELGELDIEEESPDFGPVDMGPSGGPPTLFGLNRTFAIIGAVVALVVCLGIIGLVVIIQGSRGPSDVQLTVTAVYATNTYVAYALDLTETRNAISAIETATAASWTATPSPTPTETPTLIPSPTVEQPTQVPIIVTPSLVSEGLNVSVIEQTATALAAILLGSPAGPPTPTQEAGQGGGVIPPGVIVTPTPISMPQTGLFDQAFGDSGGVNGLLTAALAAIGLAAIIVVSRRLRTQ